MASEMGEAIEQSEPVLEEPMQHRQIILEDGRYMIFYTFGDSPEGGENQLERKEDV
ncbi:MAG: hypothetical protein H0U23_06955 [Blastocatellia bacterium]|nr:hypothetical protein [Blastocatellia bacterium]